MNISIIPITTEEQIHQLADTAKGIWEEHFTPIIGKEQVSYMVSRFQSFPALKEAIEKNGYEYYFFLADDQIAGYTGIHVENYALFLSKLYVKKEFRGNKISSFGLNFLIEKAKKENLKKIWLTCNRHNENTLKIYRHFGFETVREEDNDIGNGFYMNDYIMEKAI